jgi:hypothetical protein
MPKIRPEVAACLDEIEEANELLLRKKKYEKEINSFIRRQKAILKELGYKGSIKRKRRTTK